ncbi:MAG TPA: hypothetical protein VGO31_06650 [Microbacteriaceae bacterium]|nr:hypothetical protein [Microbacteriaceae bacterium]
MKVGLLLLSGVLATVVGLSGSAFAHSPKGADLSDCAVTKPNGRVPTVYGFPAHDAGVNHGNGRLYVGLYDAGTVSAAQDELAADGSVNAKFGWWRSVRGTLHITATRLDEPASPARAHIPSAYGKRGFQPSGIAFPTAGCWRVTGTVDHRALLRFVTLVVVQP